MSGNPSLEFVTLFDRHYALRGLALWRSLDRHLEHFRLWIVAMDTYTEQLVQSLGLKGVEVIPVHEIEDAELREKKRERSAGEYCWTLTPRVFDAVFTRSPLATAVIYIDADVWLRRSPQPVLDSFQESSADVFVTEHAYHPAFDLSATSGYFCVQFLGAKRGSSVDIIGKWQDQCTEWCFAYSDRGRFGDQAYLNDWPRLYGNRIQVSQRKEWFQGPWNAMRFAYSEAIAYHFHSFVHLNRGRFGVGSYPIPKPHRDNLYRPYREDLEWAESLLGAAGLKSYGLASRRYLFITFLGRLRRALRLKRLL